MKKISILLIYLFIAFSVWSQNQVTGTFKDLAKTQIKLIGYKGFNTFVIDSVYANEKGQFKLTYDTKDFGMAYLLSEDTESVIILLAANENLILSGNNFAFTEGIKIINGKQNIFFERYASDHPRREQTSSAWVY